MFHKKPLALVFASLLTTSIAIADDATQASAPQATAQATQTPAAGNTINAEGNAVFTVNGQALQLQPSANNTPILARIGDIRAQYTEKMGDTDSIPSEIIYASATTKDGQAVTLVAAPLNYPSRMAQILFGHPHALTTDEKALAAGPLAYLKSGVSLKLPANAAPWEYYRLDVPSNLLSTAPGTEAQVTIDNGTLKIAGDPAMANFKNYELHHGLSSLDKTATKTVLFDSRDKDNNVLYAALIHMKSDAKKPVPYLMDSMVNMGYQPIAVSYTANGQNKRVVLNQGDYLMLGKRMNAYLRSAEGNEPVDALIMSGLKPHSAS